MPTKGAPEVAELALAALYLRGSPPRPNLVRRNWRAVLSCLLRADAEWAHAPFALRAEGLNLEALALEIGSITDWAKRWVDEGVVITAGSPGYPARWIERLQDAAPPALWVRGDQIPQTSSILGIVGSRDVEEHVFRYAFEVGVEAVRLGRTVISGNAQGCDVAGMRGAMSAGKPSNGGGVLAVLPHGMDFLTQAVPGVAYLSVCAPNEEFSRETAMERNVLIYAAAPQTVVAHARLRVGGSWHGAVDAHRRRLSKLVIRRDESEPGLRALIALGGIPMEKPSDLESVLSSSPDALFE